MYSLKFFNVFVNRITMMLFLMAPPCFEPNNTHLVTGQHYNPPSLFIFNYAQRSKNEQFHLLVNENDGAGSKLVTTMPPMKTTARPTTTTPTRTTKETTTTIQVMPTATLTTTPSTTQESSTTPTTTTEETTTTTPLTTEETTTTTPLTTEETTTTTPSTTEETTATPTTTEEATSTPTTTEEATSTSTTTEEATTILTTTKKIKIITREVINPKEDYLFLAYVSSKNGDCTATLIHPHYLLTHSYCVEDARWCYYYLRDGTKVIEIKPHKIIYHPRRYEGTDYQIALVNFKESVNIEPACLKDGHLSGNEILMAVGAAWNVQQIVRSNFILYPNCPFNEMTGCAGMPGGWRHDYCDTRGYGAAIIVTNPESDCKFWVIGMTFMTPMQCGGRDEPDRFTLLAPHLKWIQDVIKKG